MKTFQILHRECVVCGDPIHFTEFGDIRGGSGDIAEIDFDICKKCEKEIPVATEIEQAERDFDTWFLPW